HTLPTHPVRNPLPVPASQKGTLTEPDRPTWQYIAVGASFANLMFFRRWTEILTFSPGDAYVLRVPPEPVQYYAAIVNTLQVGVIFCLFTLLISRWRSGPLCRLSRMIWLLTLLKPLDAIRKVALETMP